MTNDRIESDERGYLQPVNTVPEAVSNQFGYTTCSASPNNVALYQEILTVILCL